MVWDLLELVEGQLQGAQRGQAGENVGRQFAEGVVVEPKFSQVRESSEDVGRQFVEPVVAEPKLDQVLKSGEGLGVQLAQAPVSSGNAVTIDASP